MVSAGEDKILQLPENAISLSAFAVPKESEGGDILIFVGAKDSYSAMLRIYQLLLGEHYKYEWTLVSQPVGDETGVMSDTNLPTMKLSQVCYPFSFNDP